MTVCCGRLAIEIQTRQYELFERRKFRIHLRVYREGEENRGRNERRDITGEHDEAEREKMKTGQRALGFEWAGITLATTYRVARDL